VLFRGHTFTLHMTVLIPLWQISLLPLFTLLLTLSHISIRTAAPKKAFLPRATLLPGRLRLSYHQIINILSQVFELIVALGRIILLSCYLLARVICWAFVITQPLSHISLVTISYCIIIGIILFNINNLYWYYVDLLLLFSQLTLILYFIIFVESTFQATRLLILK
jgi:hypothetical protein